MKRSSALLALTLGVLPAGSISCGPAESTPSSGDHAQLAVPIRALAEAMGQHRVTEFRLAGGLDHIPCEIPSGNSDLVPQAICQTHLAPERLARAEQRVRARLAGSRPSERLHALAVLGLWGRQPSVLDRAIGALREAADQESESAYILNDLGVAYTLRAARDQQPRDLVAALESFERATLLAPSLPEARFNLALTLERFSLRTDARIEWESYFRVEIDSAWTEEGAQHLRSLASPTPAERWTEDRQLLEQAALTGRAREVLAIVERHVQRARETIERELLRDWATAFSKHQLAEATQALTVAREIAQALATLRGERLPLAAVEAIDSAVSRTQLERLAAGHLALVEGYRLYREARTREALARLAEARDLLHSGQSPASLWANYFEACAIYQLEDYTGSIQALDHLEEQAPGQGFLSLEAHLDWMQGQNRLVTGRPLEALSLFRTAADRFSAAGEIENSAALYTLVGLSLDSLGRHQEAWKSFYTALRSVPEMRDPKRLFIIYAESATASLRQNLSGVALRFQNELVLHAAQTQNPQLHANSLFWRGLMKEVGRVPGGGQKDLGTARIVGETLKDEMSRARFTADLAFVEGFLAAQRRPEWALSRLNEAIHFYDRVHLRVQSASLAYHARARVHRAVGRPDLAETDLRAGMEIAEQQMRSSGPVSIRWAYLEKPGGIFAEMIQFLLDERRDQVAAFDVAERARSLSLPLLASNPGGPAVERPLTSAAILDALPPQTTLVHFTVLPDRLCVWVLSPRRFELYETPMDRQALLQRIAAWRRQGWKEAGGTSLYDLLIRRWISTIPADHLLVVVPDPALQGLPFAALRDARTGRYLIEGIRLVSSPSASLFIVSSQHQPPRSKRMRALAVGNPAFDPRFRLLPLPAAREEALLVGNLYPGSTVLTDEEADRERFLAALPRVDLLHIATHTLVNQLQPEQSMLVLARPRTGQSAGTLLAHELSRLDLRHIHLVVLSACQTGSNADAQGEEGISSLSRAFLLAGAPTVVASLWDIDDRASAQLFSIFYRQLQAGHNPSQALRDAQLSLLRSDDPDLQMPKNWAAFQVLGASPEHQPER